MLDADDKVTTVADAARRLRVSRSQISELCLDGVLRHRKAANGRDISDVDVCKAEARLVTPVTPAAARHKPRRVRKPKPPAR